MLRVPSIRIVQRGVNPKIDGLPILVTALTRGQLTEYVEIDRWSPDNEKGYQRPLLDRRLREVAKYVQSEEGVFPTSILVATRSGTSIPIVFESQEDLAGGSQFGWLTIPDGAVLQMVDGQNRLFGVERAYVNSGEPVLEDYPFPVTIMENVDRYMEMVHFNIVNTRQKRMPTDIVDRHLVQMQEVKGLDMIASGARGEKQYRQATATKIVDQLYEADSPWQHNISIPGVAGRDRGLVRQHAMVASLEPVLKDEWIKSQNPLIETVVALLCNYWNALRDVWPEAFEEPADYRIQATVGIYSLHMFLPTVIQRSLSHRDISRSRIAELIQGMNISPSFWHKVHGDPYTLGTGMASIRALAQYFINELPASEPIKVTM